MRRYDQDLVVVDGGLPAGLVASLTVPSAGARVVLIEKGEMGGDCLHRGCVSLKTLLASGRAESEVRRASRFGIDASLHGIRFERAKDRVRSVIASIGPKDPVQRYEDLGVECATGSAARMGPRSVECEIEN